MRERQWTVTALAEHWGFSRRHVTAQISNPQRGQLWDDAFRGLPTGPGRYRAGIGASARPKRLQAPAVQLLQLQVGALVASEATMDTFDYGARGVVIGLAPSGWRVIWDGGTEMEIDQACLAEWVADLGLVHSAAETLSTLPEDQRASYARGLDLYA